MTLVDTSAWAEYLRDTGSAVHHRLREAIGNGEPLYTTDVVVMEVVAGGRDERHAADLRRLVSICDFLPLKGLQDFEEAARLYRQCRRGGETVRALNDCLIAAVAVRHSLSVLHADRDYEVLARHTDLRTTAP